MRRGDRRTLSEESWRYRYLTRLPSPKRPVTDGPFADAEELVAGFWIRNVRSIDEAVEWAEGQWHSIP